MAPEEPKNYGKFGAPQAAPVTSSNGIGAGGGGPIVYAGPNRHERRNRRAQARRAA